MFRKKPAALKITDSIAHKYQGPGVALAACMNDKIIDLVYLTDIFPDFDGSINSPKSIDLLTNLMENPKAAPTIQKLQTQGKVYTGMCNENEFVVLRLGWYI